MDLSFSDESQLTSAATEVPKFTQPQDAFFLKSTRHLFFSELPNYSSNTSRRYDVDVVPEVQDLTGRTTTKFSDQESYSACDPNPCQNGGECEKLQNTDGFQCHCPDSFGGLLCSDAEEFKGELSVKDNKF